MPKSKKSERQYVPKMNNPQIVADLRFPLNWETIPVKAAELDQLKGEIATWQAACRALPWPLRLS